MIGQRTNATSRGLRCAGSRGRLSVDPSRIFVTVLLLATLLVACGGGAGAPTSVSGVSVTLDSTEIAVGEQVSASATVQGTGSPSQGVTWSTSESAIATVDASGLVSGAGTGTADVIATSQADGTVSGKATITVVPAIAVSCSAPKAFSGAITTDTTIERDCYDVTGVVSVSGGATLTIAPGTIMRFANTSGVKVEIDGALIAAGTATEPIVLRGNVASAAAWLGLHVRSGDPRNVLDHVTVEYAGRHNTSFHNSAQTQFRSGVRLAGSGARLSITNSTLRGNDNTGIRLGGGVTLDDFVNNVFDANAGTPMIIESNQIGMLDAASDYAGDTGVIGENTLNHIDVRGSTVTLSQTWPAVSVPYRLSGFTLIDDASAAITVQPGARFQGSSASGIRVDAGSFAARGTADERIVFSGTSPSAGAWLGIYFRSDDAGNALVFVTVEDGGQHNTSFTGTAQTQIAANVRVAGDARLELEDSLLRNSSNAGLYLAASSELTPFDPNETNTFESNDVDVVDPR